MKSLRLIGIFCCISGLAWGQDQPETVVVSPQKTNEVELEIPKTEEAPNAEFPNFKFNEEPYTNVDFSPDREVSMEPTERFANEGDLFLKRLEKKLPKGTNDNENKRQGSTTTQYLGDFRSGGDVVTIVVRDHQFQDGDLVSISINEETKLERVYLTNAPKGFKMKLKPGFNKIDFTALNQGSSGPNTAELRIYDEQGNVITLNQWNLATGVEATVVITKE